MVGNQESGSLAKKVLYVHLTDCCAVHLLVVCRLLCSQSLDWQSCV